MSGELKLDAYLPYRLSVASNAVSALIATRYEALFGLRVPEWRLVAVLGAGEPRTQQALGAATRMDKVTVSRALRTLTARGLVARRPHPGDARAQVAQLTAAGARLYRAVAPQALEMEARVLAGFTPAERAQFLALLERVEAAATAAAGG